VTPRAAPRATAMHQPTRRSFLEQAVDVPGGEFLGFEIRNLLAHLVAGLLLAQ